MGYEGGPKGCQMTYKELFPKVVERDCATIVNTVAEVRGLNVVVDQIAVLLDDAYQRGVLDGKNDVIQDPSAYDLFARADGD